MEFQQRFWGPGHCREGKGAGEETGSLHANEIFRMPSCKFIIHYGLESAASHSAKAARLRGVVERFRVPFSSG